MIQTESMTKYVFEHKERIIASIKRSQKKNGIEKLIISILMNCQAFIGIQLNMLYTLRHNK